MERFAVQNGMEYITYHIASYYLIIIFFLLDSLEA